MCSIAAMPADYELIVAHSPPVFSHSPPSYFASYSSCRTLSNSPIQQRCAAATSSRPSPTPLRRTASLPAKHASLPDLNRAPGRPILVLRPPTTSDGESSSDDEPQSPTRTKKRVVFADDRGLSLTQVRMMSEPSFMPPSWSSQFLRLVTQSVSAEVAPEPWECLFPQPASDYLEFRRRLEADFVSLENVIVRESEESVVGTVKVKNVAFEKEVFIRSSADGWATQEDAFCTFVNNAIPTIPGSVKVIYDTFSFKLTLPPRSRRIEFCVCYHTDNKEFWDSNSGKNYVLVKKTAGGPSSSSMPIPSGRRPHDAVYAKLDSWSEFASWNHLSNDIRTGDAAAGLATLALSPTRINVKVSRFWLWRVLFSYTYFVRVTYMLQRIYLPRGDSPPFHVPPTNCGEDLLFMLSQRLICTETNTAFP